ncbi:MAG: phytanoyl-CoA dioxygenase family protein [Gemmataceae bacterium]
MKLSRRATDLEAIDRAGYVIVPGAFTAAEVRELIAESAAVLARPEAARSLLCRGNGIYGARNLLDLWPAVAKHWQRPPLPELLHQALSRRFGLVRALYFDKHEETWSLPWHKDLTIAVRERRPSARFTKPTVKAGVPHVEAPVELLEQMLTLRIHLDDVTAANGPMIVLPGSHTTGKQLVIDETKRVNIEVARGDVLAIRPLVAHASAASQPGHAEHRRVLHLEFAGQEELEDGLAWHRYIQCRIPNAER